MADPYDPPGRSRPSSPLAALSHPLPIALGSGLAASGLLMLSLLLMFGWPAGALGIGGAAVGIGGGIAAIALAVRRRTALGWAGAALGGLSAAFWAMVGLQLASWATTGFARGRQLRERGTLRFAPVGPGADWAPPSERIEVPEALREGLASAWRENGRTEHASVAAFARVSLELMALGAPPRLLADASRDSLDEIRHAELCFGLARALDGRAGSPGPFPEAATAGALSGGRTARLVALAVTSLVDGALHEGLSARVIAKLARRCELPAVRAVLEELAADEGRHAAHGWEVVEWCAEVGGPPVRAALRAAVEGLPQTVHSPLPQPAEGGGWERYGIVGRALEQEQYARARAQLGRRLEELLGEIERRAA